MKYPSDILVTNVAHHLDSVYKRTYTPAIIMPSGECFYIENGVRILQKDFYEKYPIVKLESNSIDKGKRLDGMARWL